MPYSPLCRLFLQERENETFNQTNADKRSHNTYADRHKQGQTSVNCGRDRLYKSLSNCKRCNLCSDKHLLSIKLVYAPEKEEGKIRSTNGGIYIATPKQRLRQ